MLLNQNFLSIKQDLPKISVVVDEISRDIFSCSGARKCIFGNLEWQISMFSKYSI